MIPLYVNIYRDRAGHLFSEGTPFHDRNDAVADIINTDFRYFTTLTNAGRVDLSDEVDELLLEQEQYKQTIQSYVENRSEV